MLEVFYPRFGHFQGHPKVPPTTSLSDRARAFFPEIDSSRKIHPFLDGNGRVARLFSHAFLKSLGVGNALWSVSRGLARNVSEYKARLADADSWREGDIDGRGSLTQRGLIEFCEFFLTVCVDQVRFMEQLLEPAGLLDRVRRYCADHTERKEMPKGAFEVLREVILFGALPRAKVVEVTGYRERQARSVVSALIALELLTAESPRAALRLHIPHKVVSAWFPRLYPGF
jgi:Fic family protein